MTITIQGADESGDNEMESPKKKKKKNRREVDKEFFIPYQPPDFKRERGYEDPIEFHLLYECIDFSVWKFSLLNVKRMNQ
jgi:hypothetical protein